MLLVFAVYPAYPAACDHAYPVPALSLMRMSYTTGFTSFHRIRVSVKSSHLVSIRIKLSHEVVNRSIARGVAPKEKPRVINV